MICDFHSHVLFKVDDGAKDMATSLEMLKMSAKHGVDTVLVTSHCYPESSRDIDRFIAKRDAAYDAIIQQVEIPRLHKACEVHVTQDISKFPNIRKLCIEGTDYMLVEMPSTPWTDKTIDTVYKLTLKGIIPIIAHNERNMKQKAELRDALYDLDVLVQINASSLFSVAYKKYIDKMMRHGIVHVIGTDMHNMTTRKPCLDKAKKRIMRRYGEGCWYYLMDNAERILNGEVLSYRDFRRFKKKSIF